MKGFELRGSEPKQRKYTIWLFFFLICSKIIIITVFSHTDLFSCLLHFLAFFSPDLCFAFEKKHVQKNSVFPGGVVWRSFVKQETKKAFVFHKRSPNDAARKTDFLHVFFLENEVQTRGGGMSGDEVNTKTSLYAKNRQFVNKIFKKPNHILMLFWLWSLQLTVVVHGWVSHPSGVRTPNELI